MNLEFSLKKNKSIFLAGPVERDKMFDQTWRRKVIDYVHEEYGNIDDLTLFIPDFEQPQYWDMENKNTLARLHQWEWKNMDEASKILFWIPRDIGAGLYGYTTNIEFGYWMGKDPEKVVLGYPKNADRMEYIEDLYKNLCPNHVIFDNLNTMIDTIIGELYMDKLTEVREKAQEIEKNGSNELHNNE